MEITTCIIPLKYIYEIQKDNEKIKFDQPINTILTAINIDDAKYIISDIDILEYNWNDQILKVGSKLNNIDFKDFIHIGYFIVDFDGNRLFGGLVTSDLSSMAIDQSVLVYKKIESYHSDGEFNIFAFRPHSSTYDTPPYPFLGTDETIAEQVKAHFQALGTLTE